MYLITKCWHPLNSEASNKVTTIVDLEKHSEKEIDDQIDQLKKNGGELSRSLRLNSFQTANAGNGLNYGGLFWMMVSNKRRVLPDIFRSDRGEYRYIFYAKT